jgi:predicted PurR-regulated permease PerM
MTDSRRLALTVIAVLVAVFALHWARTFFVSLFMGILIAYALNPVVVRLQRVRVPRWAGSTLVMVALCAAGVLAAGSLGDQVGAVLEQVPDLARKISARLSSKGGEPGTL